MSDTGGPYEDRLYSFEVQRAGEEYDEDKIDPNPNEGRVGVIHVLYDDQSKREFGVHAARVVMSTGRPNDDVPWIDYYALPEAMRTRLIRSKAGPKRLIEDVDSAVDRIGHRFAHILINSLQGKIAIAPVPDNIAAASQFFYIWEPNIIPPAFCFLHSRAGAIEFAALHPPRVTMVPNYHEDFPKVIEGAILPSLTQDASSSFGRVDPFVYVSSPFRSYIAERQKGFKATITAMIHRTADEILDRSHSLGIRPGEAAEIRAQMSRLSGAVIRYAVDALNKQDRRPSAKADSTGRFSLTEDSISNEVRVHYDDPRLGKVPVVSFQPSTPDNFRTLSNVFTNVVLPALNTAEQEIIAAPRRALLRRSPGPAGSTEPAPGA